MGGFRTFIFFFSSFRARLTVLAWMLTAIAVTLVFGTGVVASASDSQCTTRGKHGSMNLLDVSSQHHVRYKKKYDIDCIGERGVDKGLDFYSWKREEKLGEEMAKELDVHLQFIRDPEIDAYVSGLVQDLAMHSDAQVPFTVKVVKDDDVNAYSLPGGYLYVNTGLIMDVPDEATLAGLLAHEIAHVAARHGTKILTKRYILKLATLPLTFVGGAALSATDMAVPVLMLKFSRDSEREADLLGIEYAYSAGYDPEAFVRFFENLDVRTKQKVPFVFKMFFTHPVSKDRIKRAQQEIETLLPSKPEYIVDSSEFDDMKLRLSSLLESPCEGSNGKPVLLGPTRHCPDTGTAEPRPKLVPLPQPPKPKYVLGH